MNLIQAIILAIIEGLTEFLPISSTGHMILTTVFMDIHENSFVKTYEIAIQLGAILAIVILYSERFLKGLEIYYKLLIAFIPTAIIGFLAYEFIKSTLFNPIVVAISLIIGGIILILIDKRIVKKESKIKMLENISYRNAFFIGLIQCFSMIPGTSRAAATIIGGVFNGLDKKQATEFSFLLAVPTMFAATIYDFSQANIEFNTAQLIQLVVGLITAFFSALIAVKIFLKIIQNYGFKHFGYYRILLGLLFLFYFY